MVVKTYILMIIAAFFSCKSVLAQERGATFDSKEGCVIFKAASGDDLFTMKSRDDDFSLVLSGIEIGFGSSNQQNNEKYRQSAPKTSCRSFYSCSCADVCNCVSGSSLGYNYEYIRRDRRRRSKPTGYIGIFEFGFTNFGSPNYDKYRESDHGFLDLRKSKSIFVGWNVLSYNRNLVRSGAIGFSAAYGVAFSNYVFDNNITVRKNDQGILVPAPLDKNYKKTKLTTFSHRVTVALGGRISKNLRIGAGVYGEFIQSAHTKYKKPKQKYGDSLFNINQWQAGLTANAGFKNIRLFGHYQLTDYFKNNKGPQTNVYTLGVAIYK